MPSVNWDAFSKLPGSAETNFEMLCRGLVRRHYARYGEFRALASQPGVEFHVRLLSKCQLGDAGRWYGWQCRWYDLPGGRALGKTRRTKIAKAISLTEKVLLKLTDWVLWTRRPLTAGDQKWFFALKTHMQLHLWTSADVEDHLSGDAEVLRGTYFGELVLTPDTLAQLHEVSVAPIRIRWNPAVHQTIDAERELRRMLVEPGTWQDLRAMSQQLTAEAKAVRADMQGLPDPLISMAAEVATAAETLTTALTEGHAALERGDLDILGERTAGPSLAQLKRLAPVPRHLRAYRHRAALSVTNALADLRRAHSLGQEVDAYPTMRLVAVTAEAGCGKTELAAQLTAPTDDRPAGILLHGRNLSACQTLDDLARNVVIQGVPVPSMEALVAAVDAAGQRAHRRLPLVIDGLNESEDARNWKPLLAVLVEVLSRYPYVLVICTLRTAFAQEALPSGVPTVDIPDLRQDTWAAIRKYFAYYRIDPIDAEFPWRLLRHPLTLRLFCEVTNPKRERVVGVEAMPGSLTELFDRYLEQASERIVELSPRDSRYYRQDVRAALDQVGWAFWEGKSRALDFGFLRNHLGDAGRSWHGSIVRLLEQEGVLLRSRRHGIPSDEMTVAYDALAGHLIADAVLTRLGQSGFVQWIRESATMASLTGPIPDRHPLASDILRAMVGLVPRRLHRQQLWSLLDEPLRSAALLWSADLEAAYLDSETIRELASLAGQQPGGARDLFDRLVHTRSSPLHPLNSTFLDAVLRPMSVAQRDLRWTEWVRSRSEELQKDLEYVEQRWHTLTPRSQSDRLQAQWVMWTLTSTAREIRDQATRALYWFGRGDPTALFSLALSSTSINDPSVPERVLAASYGVVMAHQSPNANFERDLSNFLTGLRDALAGPTAAHPTSHWLARLYVEGIIGFGLKYYRDSVPTGAAIDGKFPFAAGPIVERIEHGDPRADEVERALGRHYDDDTLSNFIGFRRRVGWGDEAEHDAVAHLRGVLWAFGWREAELGVVDERIPSGEYRRGSGKAQRYSNKYAWIGLYTYPEVLNYYSDMWHGRRPPDVQIDPSFPERSPVAPLTIRPWAASPPADDRKWVRRGPVDVPDELFYLHSIGPHRGPWVAVFGSLNSRTKAPDRGVFGLLTGLLVDPRNADSLVTALETKDYPGNWWLPRAPEDYYIFAGEIPWHPEFARGSEDGEQMYRGELSREKGSPIEVEILAHDFSWESYHSALHQAGGAYVPSALFSERFDLRGIPQSFDQCLVDGTRATVSLSAPAGLGGHLLYIRQDLLKQYAGRRKLIWFIWGERNLYGHVHSPPDWLVKAHRDRATVWRRILRGEQVSQSLGSKGAKRKPTKSRSK